MFLPFIVENYDFFVLSKFKTNSQDFSLSIASLKKKCFFPRSLIRIQFCGEPPWPRCSVLGLGRQGSHFKSCVYRAVSSHPSHHPQDVILAQFSLYVYKGGLKPHSFYFISIHWATICPELSPIKCDKAMIYNGETTISAPARVAMQYVEGR